MWQGMFIHAWSKTLSTLALSSGEAELGAVVRGAAEGLGVIALLGDFGIKSPMVVRSDATAAIGMVGRLGIGKVRHLATSDLWLQQAARRKELCFYKVYGGDNPADLLTKPLDANTAQRHMQRSGLIKLGGRAAIAPERKCG